MHPRKLIQKQIFQTCSPLSKEEILGITFLDAFCHKSLDFWNVRNIQHLLMTVKSTFWHFLLMTRKVVTNDEEVTW
jgi:hypothetical protein